MSRGATATGDALDTTELARQLAATGRLFAQRGLCPATGGNFSARIDDQHILITASGVDKTTITPDGLLTVGMDGSCSDTARPSAETDLHLALYRRAETIGAVLHGHSLANTVLSRMETGEALVFEGYEMQKSISGQTTHAAVLNLPILDNSQDMDALAATLEARFDDAEAPHGVLVRGHGIYAWGADLAAASRHLEGWEFLLACELQRRQLCY